MGRWLGYGAGAGLIAAALIYAFWPVPEPVDVAPVMHGPMMVTIEDEGETQVRDVYVVSAPLSGHVDRIAVKVGDDVRGGETVIATMQETEPAFLDLRARRRAEAAVEAAQAAYRLATADRDRAVAELDYARSEWERSRALADRGTISDAALDRARLALRTQEAALATAEAAVRVRQSELDNARAELIDPNAAAFDQPAGAGCCVPVYAPVDGKVLTVLRESAGVVAMGTPLVEVGDPGNLEVVVDLLSRDAVQVKPGDAVLIDDWGGPGSLDGVVRLVEPSGFTKVSALGIEEQRVNVRIDPAGGEEGWKALGHGYRVEVRVVTWRSDDVLLVPAGALFRRGGDWAVFAMEEGRARLTQVELGHVNSDVAELLGGLDDEAVVVLHPSDRIADGVRIVQRRVE